MTSIYGIDPILDYTFAQAKPKYCLDLKYEMALNAYTHSIKF